MEKSEKKYRQRNKQRRNAIRQQMEFYFSDSNLTKDRYLSQLVKNSTDSYVEISEFLKFNKIKSLTESIEDIAKAVTGSELIQLSEDQTKVKRKTDLQVKADADECTLYVESLPKHATHDYVKEIFSRFGTVTYVSLPKYKHSRKIKEFGFVEYENQESVIKAIEAFKQWNGVLVYQDADPNKLQSVVSFNEEQKIEKRNKDKGECEDQGQKRENDEDTEPPNKKMRTESECTENQENESMLNEMTESSAKEDETEENKSELKETSESKTSQKKKKTKTVTPITEEKVFDMKIMPKREWKRLRNKYLNLQRERFKEIKQKLQAGRKQQEKKQEKKKPAPTPSKATIKTSSPRKINFYGALPFDKKSGSDENTDDQEVPSRLKKPLFSFEPGLIVNIKFQEPLVDVKEFKQELKNLSFIKYIDVKEGDPEAFVRVDKFASANQLVKFYANSDYQTQILSGEVEQIYWQKMIKDREQKLNKNIKPNKVRGREKLSKKIAQHIRFDE